MNNMEIINELKELNLDDNEIKVYMACLSLGSSKVNEIAKRAALIRTTCYGVLKTLIEKGLISNVLKNEITYYQAASPKQLVEMLDEKKRKINSILPQLERIKEFVPIMHDVQLFEGSEGLKTVINDFISKPNQTIKLIGTIKGWLEAFPQTYLDVYYRKKKERGIIVNVLVDEKDRPLKQSREMTNSQYRFIKDLNAESSIYIYNDKVAFSSYSKGNHHGVIINNKELFNLMTNIFDMLWKQAKK